MEAIIFIGLQASGKSTLYRERFWRSHIRISLDMLKTRHRERWLLRTCLEMRQPFVVDNTNPSVAERAVYLSAAREAGFRVIGYYFQSHVSECLRRNSQRDERDRVPAKAIPGTAGRLELPTYAEGFDQLCYVRIAERDSFVIEEWQHEV